MLVDGRQISEEIINSLAAQRSRLPEQLSLGVLMGEGNAATDSFVRIKEKVAARLQVAVVREVLGVGTTTERAVVAATQLARAHDGVILQLPLPPDLAIEKIAAVVPPIKDPDVFNGTNALVQPPVAEAIAEILMRSGVSLRGMQAVVV